MNHRRYTYLVGEDILLLKRRYTSFLRETHRSLMRSGMGALLLLLLTLTACVGEELQKPLLGEGEGYLRLQVAPVSAEISTSPLTKAEIPTEQIPKPNECAIKITNKSTGKSTTYANSAALPDPLVLKAGVTYTVAASSGTDEALQESPYFYGSEDVTIQPNQSNDVTVTASLANAMLVPVVDDDLKKHYSKWTLSVKAGSSQPQDLASNSMERYLYVQRDLPIEITFSGTNLIDGSTSKTEKVTDAAQPRTQYTIQCNPKNLPSFNLEATAIHTQDEKKRLNGTKVQVNVTKLEGTFTEAIKGWEAKLYNANDTLVRTYSASSAPSTDEKNDMLAESGWPYLPQGEYTLRYALTLQNGESTAKHDTKIIVPAPEFLVSASAYTSYNKYLEHDLDGETGANKIDGSTIYAMQAVPTIAPELLNNTNYTQSSALTLDGEPVSAGDKGLQTWKAHTLVASYTFDGVTVESGPTTYHVTGLPYTFNFYNNETEFKNSGWVGYNTRYNVERKFMLEEDGNNGYVISPKFHIPSTVNTDYAIQAQYYRAWGINVSSKTIELRVGITSTNTAVAEIYNSHTCPGDNNTGKSYGTYSESLTFSSSSYVSFHHNNANVNAQIDYLCLYEFVLKYKKK